ncbi:MAG: cobalamin-dependent protein, partial [Paracoccaceae bacterium]
MVIKTETRKSTVDLLLVYPPWTVLNSRGVLTNALPPQGILSIAAYAEAKGFKVKVIDIHVERMSQSDFHKIVRECQPKLIGITVLSSMIAVTHAIAKEVKNIVPTTKV